MVLRLLSGLSLAAALAACLALGGCGGVEFQGKLFDYAGLSGDRTQKDPKMAERAPLVLPPDTNTLPPPGEPTYAAREDWPTDTDAQRKKVAAAAQAKQTADDVAADPTNPYAGKPTLLDKAFGKLIKKKDSDEDEVADVPEPDPSDKTPEDEAREQKAVAANGAPKPLDQPIIEAPKPEQDPFHPAAPDSYKQMSGQDGN